MVHTTVFRAGRYANERRMSPGNKLGAAFLTPQRKHCNTQVKLTMPQSEGL